MILESLQSKVISFVMKVIISKIRLAGILFILLFSSVSLLGKSQYKLSPVDVVEEQQTSTRSRVILNGVWEFAPALVRGEAKPEDSEWGKILVPGFVTEMKNYAGIVERKNTARWKNIITERSWWRRTVMIPQSWNGEIVLALEHIRTCARVYINGKEAGIIAYPQSELDISNFVKAGEVAKIELLLSSYQDRDEIKNDKPVKETPKTISLAGIQDGAFLFLRPKGTKIDGIFIRTSLEYKTLEADLELSNVVHDERLNAICKIIDANGKVVKEFSTPISTSKNHLKVTISTKWENPKLWDIKTPNLYTLDVVIEKNGKILDEFKERFGFREFKIVGKDFFLNGKKIHLRPLHNFYEAESAGVRTAISNVVDSMLECNFNAFELWPYPHEMRSLHFRKLWTDVADEKGMLVLYPAYASSKDLNWKWEDSKAREAWLAKFLLEWKKIRNSPSVVALMTLSNTFANYDTSNPMKIGNSMRYSIAHNLYTLTSNDLAQGDRLISFMKTVDPTRPVSGHHACSIGDFHSLNHYLNYVPLQDREEWLSEWAKCGNVPFCAIECGTPFFGNFVRDRSNPYKSYTTEPLLTEFVAPYLGSSVYKNESDEYRNMIAERYLVKEKKWKNLNNETSFLYAKNMSDFQALFNKNTWRSWRAWGLAGGMVPWRDAYGWESENGFVDVPFKDASLECQPTRLTKRGYYGMSNKGAKANASGQAIIDNQKPALAWIGGKVGMFTDKSHHFYSGETVSKSAVLTNDLRETAKYFLDWSVTLDGKEIAKGKFRGVVGVSETSFVPLNFKAPDVDKKTKGKILLNGKFGGIENSDTFDFTVYPKTKFPTSAVVKIFDPSGRTKTALEKVGIKTSDWNGDSNGGLLIIGENALSENINGDINKFVEDGGAVLIFAQKEDILENGYGLRTSKFVSRRMFPVESMREHSFVKGLDAEDFRDWRGAGTFLPERENVEVFGNLLPTYGWRWTNRGSVASVAIEKPHKSAWRPILEGEFDLSFTPLAEKNIGKGIAVYCALDVIARTQSDPVADIVLSRLIGELSNYKPAKNSANVDTHYIGGKRGSDFLKSLEMEFKEVSTLPKSGLVIVGENSKLSDDEIKSAMERGVNFILIERDTTPTRLGVSKHNGKVSKVLQVPTWEHTKGMSLSDVRVRSDVKAKIFDSKLVEFGGTWIAFRVGKDGVAYAISLLPDELDLEKAPYLKYTTWRMSRAFVQLAGNLGAKFAWDSALIDKRKPVNAMTDDFWKFAYAESIKGSPSDKDFDDSNWEAVSFPKNLDRYGNLAYPFPKQYWIRKHVFIPSNWKGKSLTFVLGRVVGGDKAFFNGVKIGEEPKSWEAYKIVRKYDVPHNIIKYGSENIISVFVDPVSSGRLTGPKVELNLKEESKSNQYMPNYVDDIADGDSPFRFMGW